MRKPKEVTNPFTPEQMATQAAIAAAEVPWDPNENNEAADEVHAAQARPLNLGSATATAPVDTAVDFVDSINTTAEIPERDDSWLDELRAPLPQNLIKYRTESWGDVAYVEWHTVADILDQTVGSKWDFRIQDVEVNQFAVICKGELTISMDRPSWQSTTRVGLGVAPIRMHGGSPNIELAAKSAASDALKRAAVLFGIGRDLYTGEIDEAAPQEQNTAARATHTRPAQAGYQRPTGSGFQMRDPGAPATPKQIGMCKAIAQRLGMDVYAEAQEVMGVHLDNATKSEISTFIEHLMAMNQNG